MIKRHGHHQSDITYLWQRLCIPVAGRTGQRQYVGLLLGDGATRSPVGPSPRRPALMKQHSPMHESRIDLPSRDTVIATGAGRATGLTARMLNSKAAQRPAARLA